MKSRAHIDYFIAFTVPYALDWVTICYLKLILRAINLWHIPSTPENYPPYDVNKMFIIMMHYILYFSENETEISYFNREEYDQYKANPQMLW